MRSYLLSFQLDIVIAINVSMTHCLIGAHAETISKAEIRMIKILPFLNVLIEVFPFIPS